MRIFEFLRQLLVALAAFIQGQRTERQQRRQRLARLRDAIEQVVDASEPRLRLVDDYADKLLEAVEIATRHCEALARQLPPPLTLGVRAWASDSRVNAFFATVADLRTTLSENRDLQLFFQQPDRPSECFALLLMIKQESQILAPALEGDFLVREVRRTVVNFSEHQLYFPSRGESELRQELRRGMLGFLASQGRDRLAALRERRDALEEQRRQLKAQRQAFEGRDQSARPSVSGANPDAQRLATLERRLAEVERELADARQPLATLDDYLEQIRQILAQPEPYLHLHPVSLRLSRLGVKLEEQSSEPGATLALFELDSLQQHRIGALVRFNRAELLDSDH